MPTTLPVRAHVRTNPAADAPFLALCAVALVLFAAVLAVNPTARPMAESDLFEILAASP